MRILKDILMPFYISLRGYLQFFFPTTHAHIDALFSHGTIGKDGGDPQSAEPEADLQPFITITAPPTPARVTPPTIYFV